MSYRPITDVWFLARPKVKYYGAYPNGFLERAKPLIGVATYEPVLHVCGGRAKDYPNKRMIGNGDHTLDLDPALRPDFLQDARDPLPRPYKHSAMGWAGILIDRPYTPEDAAHYAPGAEAWPNLRELLRNALTVVAVGKRVGVLDYELPRPDKGVRFIACVAVYMGFGNMPRTFSVFERGE